MSLLNIGQTHQLKKEYALALPFLEKGLEKAKACNSKELLKSAHETFADVFEHLGTPKKAWENYQLFIVSQSHLSCQTMDSEQWIMDNDAS